MLKICNNLAVTLAVTALLSVTAHAATGRLVIDTTSSNQKTIILAGYAIWHGDDNSYKWKSPSDGGNYNESENSSIRALQDSAIANGQDPTSDTLGIVKSNLVALPEYIVSKGSLSAYNSNSEELTTTTQTFWRQPELTQLS